MANLFFADECGIVAQISEPLATADIPAYYISTFKFDHALVRREPRKFCSFWLNTVNVPYSCMNRLVDNGLFFKAEMPNIWNLPFFLVLINVIWTVGWPKEDIWWLKKNNNWPSSLPSEGYKNTCVFSRFQKKTSKVWSELCGPRARLSEGSRRGENGKNGHLKKKKKKKSFRSNVYHVQKVPRAH